MKKIASFIVNKRYLVLGVLLALTIFCAFLIPQVEVNADMTKYLPDDSPMKQGVDLMEQEFENAEMMQTIRVMFEGLPQEEKADVKARLEAIANVDSVTYSKTSDDHNSGDYTLYILNTACDYNSPEENAIQRAVPELFAGYAVTVKNDNANDTALPLWCIVVAITILMIILFTMSSSWFEPLLFLVAIGAAIIINTGSNTIFGSVSNTTFSIAAILQLILSMDYSIILMNRYRQEQPNYDDKRDAMKAALRGAFSAITSSAVTTFVGLLMLVFMNFKIGKDLGLVLAKGVACSLICIFTMLPGLILLCDKIIRKTAKKVPHIPMGGVAQFSHRLRRPLAAAFALLFIGTYFLQGITPIMFTTESEDPIADVFVPTNTIVMLYKNEDADKIVRLTDALEENPQVKTALSYPTTLGRPYAAAGMLDVIDDMGADFGTEMDMDIDETMLNILYYDYFRQGELPPIKAGDLIRFIADEVAPNPTFAQHLDADIIENIDTMRKFGDPAALTKPMNATELADFFDMDAGDIKQLFLYYYTQNGAADSGRMTLATFAGFLKNDVLSNPDYSQMVPTYARDQIDELVKFSDAKLMTTPYSYGNLARLMGMSAGDAKLLYVYYYAIKDGYNPGGMSIPAFVDFVRSDVATNPAFATQFPAGAMEQMNMLAPFTDPAAIQKQLSGAELAGMLGMDVGMIDMLYSLYYGGQAAGSMTLPQFTGMLVGMMDNPTLAGQFADEQKAQLAAMNSLMQTIAANPGRGYTATDMGALLGPMGLDASLAAQVYSLYFEAGNPGWEAGFTMSLPQFTGFLVNTALQNPAMAGQFDEATKQQLTALHQLVGVAAANQPLSCAELGGIVGMDAADAEGLLTLGGQSAPMTLHDFLTLITTDPFVSSAISPTVLAHLQQIKGLADLALSDAGLDAATLAGALGMDQAMVRQLFLMVASAGQTMTLPQFTGFLANTVMNLPQFAAYFDEATKAQLAGLNQMVSAAAGGTQLNSAQLAGMTGMQESMVQLLLALSAGSQIPNKTMSAEQFADYLVNDAAQNPIFKDQLGDNLDQLRMLQAIMDATLKGEVYDYGRMASLFGMDAKMMKMLFTLHDSHANTGNWRLSMQQAVNFIANNSDEMGAMLGGNLSGLRMAQRMINGAVAGTRYSAGELASLLGMNAKDLNGMFLLYISEHGDTGNWLLSTQSFVDFINSDVLPNEEFADRFGQDDADSLKAAKTMIDAVVSKKAYTARELTTLLADLSDELNRNTMELMCLYYNSAQHADPTWKLSLEQMFDFMADHIADDARFADVIDDDMRADIKSLRVDLDEAMSQMIGENHSILMLSTTLPAESAQTSAFIEGLHDAASSQLTGDYYLIGSSPMTYEMENSFDAEMLLITILTALAIFLVVAITFKSLAVPTILVLIVQCGVYITVSVSGLMGYGINYMALLIVQSILMGATIDYGLVYTSYYREKRETMGVKEALKGAYDGSIHTILTSGLIMILITGLLGFTSSDPTIGQICQTLSIGTLSATLLILFVLPGLLASFDRFVTKKGKRAEDPRG